MTEQFFEINAGETEIKSIDSDLFGNYIAITKKNEIITPFIRFATHNKIRFPVIRHLGDDLFLVADRRCKATDNAFIYNYNGQLMKSFFAGDGIEDILIMPGKIIVTYFDEGVYGAKGPNNEGVAVFNFD